MHYTNEKGVSNTQLFALHVEGEGWTGNFTPYYKMNGTTGTDTLIYVKKYDELTFGMEYIDTPVREWKWEKSTNGQNWNALSHNENLMTQPSVSSNAYYRVTMTNQAGARLQQTFRVEVSEIDPFIAYGDGKNYSGTTLAVPRHTAVSLYASPNSLLAQSANSTRIYKWMLDKDTIQADTLTFHLNDLGGKVADLNDTLCVGVLDTCMEYTLMFHRVSQTGSKAETVLHFNLPVYETNTFEPQAKDSFYIKDPQTGRYLRNTDATFTGLDETDDQSFLWRIRPMPLYGDRYMFVSQTDNNKHLSDEGTLTTKNDYSKHSFNLFRKYSDEDLYAIGLSSTAGSGFLETDADDPALSVTKGSVFSEFPFVIIRKVQPNDPDGIKDCRNETEYTVNPIVSYSCHGQELYLKSKEAGILRIYSLSGVLLQTETCEMGDNHIRLLFRNKGICIGLYATSTDKRQSIKITRNSVI